MNEMKRIPLLDLGQAYRELKTEYERMCAIAATKIHRDRDWAFMTFFDEGLQVTVAWDIEGFCS
jgi:dTDP-D-glucose 4,6-dehydratase